MRRSFLSTLCPALLPVPHLALAGYAFAVIAFAGRPAAAQEEGGAEGAGPPVTIVQVPTASPADQAYGAPPGGNFDPNAHLPSGSRGTSDASRSSDGFDFGGPSGTGGSVRGSATGSFVVESQYVPEAHTVRRGDTLWDISGQYYKNPYNWPRVWAFNQQVQNPHWIYPGDRVRLREPGAATGPQGGMGRSQRRASVPPTTVFLRDVGWIDDKKEDRWGEIQGSPDDQMLLSEGDDVYIQVGEGHEIAIGQQLTIFRPLREVDGDENDEDDYQSDAKGELVSIRGTVRVDRYNPETRMVKAHIVESVDVVERGELIGPVGRRFDVVPPARNEADVEVRILAAIYPNQFFGQHQVLFLDKGEKEGLRPGNRLFAVRRGDRWRNALPAAGKLAAVRPKLHDDRAAEIEPADGPKDVDQSLFPDETYAEIRILRVRDHTATALVTASTHEVERGARLVSRKGY